MIKINQFIQKHSIVAILFIVAPSILLSVYALREVYPFGQGSVLILDLNAQYVYYYEAFRDVIFENKSLLYTFSRTLGGDMIGIYAYYLASPFSFILLLFPKHLITEAVLCMILVKVGAAAATFAIYLAVSRQARLKSVFLFSLMYALMSYIVVQTLNPMWLDGPIFFPLIILALERLVNFGKPWLYVLFLALMFVANFYIGYMIGFFTFIYFVYYYYNNGGKSVWVNAGKAYISFFSSSLLAAGLAMWLILPTYYSLRMGKFGFSQPDFFPRQQLDIFDLFSKLLPMTYDSVNYHGHPFIYSGLFTLLLVALYFTTVNNSDRKKYSTAVLLSLFAMVFMVSSLDIALHGFQGPVWLNYRYSFIFSFFMLIIAYEAFSALQEVDRKVLIRICIAFFVVTAFIGKFQYEYIQPVRTLWLSYVLLLIYCFLIYGIKTKTDEHNFPVLSIKSCKLTYSGMIWTVLILVVSLELFLNAFAMIDGAHREVYYSDRGSYRDYFERINPAIDHIKNIDDGFYRTETVIRRTVNDPMALGIYGISHSSSILNSKVINMFYRIGVASREHWTRYKGATPVTDSIFGIRYIVAEDSVNNLYKKIFLEDGIAVYENPYAMPIAFNVSSKLTELKLRSVDPFVNQNDLLNALLGREYEEYFKLIQIEEIIFENMVGADRDGIVSYNAVNPNQNAHIEYILKPADDNEMYMYLVSDYPRKVNLWLEHEYIDTFFDYNSICIIPLGAHPTKEQLSLITTPVEADYFLNHNMFYYLDTPLFIQALDTLKNNSTAEVEKISERKLRITTAANAGEILFTTIPYDAGWQAVVNGKTVDTYEVLDSLMALSLEPGEQVIELEYLPQGFVAGLYISGTALLIFIGLMVFNIIKSSSKTIEDEGCSELSSL